MCYDADARPPIYGPARTAVTTSPLLLTSADDTRIATFLAAPAEPSGVGVLVLPDNGGLSRFYERLTVHLAGQGHTALAVDYYARTAGPDYQERAADFAALPNLMPHLTQLRPDTLYADFDAGIAHLRAEDGVHARSVVSLGFCIGGRFAFLTSAQRFGLAGAIGLYGAPDAINGAPGPTQRAHDLQAPILGLFGGADPGIPRSAVEAFDAALTDAGVSHEIVTYPGAPHGFFEQELHEQADASADAWRRILGFLNDVKV
ncbi:dienelactone hydrolase family protein [Paractinoplanes rhizophilus]|uniref:Dienelactone hydrolase family protein n=1 Tax=Paractinoplanes rhizophilus TaxID=1416877 RepID=A0ABW2HRC3_9ACTN